MATIVRQTCNGTLFFTLASVKSKNIEKISYKYMILSNGYLELSKANLFSNNPMQMHFYEST